MIAVENFDPNKGYLEYYLARELAKLSHEVQIFTFGKDSKPSESIEEDFKIINLTYSMMMNGYHVPTFRGIAYIMDHIRYYKPDIIHCQPLFSPLSLIFISFSRLFNYKVVGTIFSQLSDLSTVFKKLKFNLVNLALNFYVKNRSEIIFAKSMNLMKIQKRLFKIPIHKFRIIPLGADATLFKYSDEARWRIRSSLGLSSEDIVIVYSGKLTPRKRLEILVNALEPIIKRDNRVKLLIVGKGISSYERYIRKISKASGVFGNIIFHPWVHRTLLPDFYSASDIAVWPGLSSISIIEAASVGLPLIIEKSPVEIYGLEYGNGFTFEPSNIEDLRKYLQILIYNEEIRKHMGKKSRLLVKQKLNWKSLSLQYLSAYKSALQS